jgi:hypothetical protein
MHRSSHMPPFTSRWPHRLWLLPLLVFLNGCATAVVLKEDAGAVSLATKAAVAETRSFYATLGERRLDYLISVAATGKNCRYGFPIVLLPDDTQVLGWRCLTGDEGKLRLTCLADPANAACEGEDAQALLKASQFSLSSVQQSAAIALVDAIADYQILMAKIVADPKLDTKAELTALQDRANTLKGVFDALAGNPTSRIDLSKEIDAISTLVDLVRQANEDRRDLVALRALMSSQGIAFEQNLGALAARYAALDFPTMLLFDEVQLGQDIKRLNARLPQLDEAARVKAMRALATAEAALEARKVAPKPLAQAFTALLTAHATLREAVVDGNLTEDQRRRRADVALRQMRAWFEAIRSVIAVF